MNREDYHKLLDLCIDLTEQTEYRANCEVFNIAYMAVVWLFTKDGELERSYHVDSLDGFNTVVKSLEGLLETKKPSRSQI